MVLSTQPLGVFLGGRDPYKVRGPAVISFSGGRTSAYLLWQCVRRGLDADTHVVFCNTGKERVKERVETLEFVRRCGEEWKVKIRWLEYYRRRLPRYRKREKEQLDVIERAGRTGLYQESGPEDGYVERDFETASRRGEPFENMVDLSGLPNFGTPFCSTELKTRVTKYFLKHQGLETWDAIVGIRADEAWRIAKMRENAEKGGEPWDVVAPLIETRVNVREVYDFWLGPGWNPGDPMPASLPQGFDLGLQPEDGNCDLCFKKSPAKLVQIARREPSRVEWWAKEEKRTGSVFNKKLGRMKNLPNFLTLPHIDSFACHCTD